MPDGPCSRTGARHAYRSAARTFVAVVGQLRPEQWERTGLGEWTVRELTAHTQALLTVDQYLAVGARSKRTRSSAPSTTSG